MVVIGRFLKKIRTAPQYGKCDHAEAVFVSDENAYAQNAHEREIHIHLRTHKGLQPIKTNKIEGKDWLNQIRADPTCGYCPKTFKADEQAKEDTENNQRTIVHGPGEEGHFHLE